MIDSVYLWLGIAYIAGTWIGYSVGIKNGLEKATNAVIDNLIENGYLKTRGHKNNPEILKYDSTD